MENESPAAPQESRLAYDVNEAARVSGLGRSTVYEEIGAGRLVARKVGKRTLILAADLNEWLNSLPKMEASHVGVA